MKYNVNLISFKQTGGAILVNDDKKIETLTIEKNEIPVNEEVVEQVVEVVEEVVENKSPKQIYKQLKEMPDVLDFLQKIAMENEANKLKILELEERNLVLEEKNLLLEGNILELQSKINKKQNCALGF